MAILDPYVTWAEYKARNSGIQSDADQALVEGYILSASRLIENKTGRNFNATAAGVVRYFDGNNLNEQFIDDYTALSEVAIDVYGFGDYAYLIDPASVSWLHLRPYNNPEKSQPYTSIMLLPLLGALVTLFPPGARRVRATGTWGWPAVPHEIKDATITIARQINDLVKSGITMTMQNLEQQIIVAPGMPSLLRDLQDTYSRRYPGMG